MRSTFDLPTGTFLAHVDAQSDQPIVSAVAQHIEAITALVDADRLARAVVSALGRSDSLQAFGGAVEAMDRLGEVLGGWMDRTEATLTHLDTQMVDTAARVRDALIGAGPLHAGGHELHAQLSALADRVARLELLVQGIPPA